MKLRRMFLVCVLALTFLVPFGAFAKSYQPVFIEQAKAVDLRDCAISFVPNVSDYVTQKGGFIKLADGFLGSFVEALLPNGTRYLEVYRFAEDGVPALVEVAVGRSAKQINFSDTGLMKGSPPTGVLKPFELSVNETWKELSCPKLSRSLSI